MNKTHCCSIHPNLVFYVRKLVFHVAIFSLLYATYRSDEETNRNLVAPSSGELPISQELPLPELAYVV